MLVHAYLTRFERVQRGESLERALNASNASLEHARRDRQAAPAAYRWRGSYEWLRGNPASARKWWERSADAARRLGTTRELQYTKQERDRLERGSAAGGT